MNARHCFPELLPSALSIDFHSVCAKRLWLALENGAFLLISAKIFGGWKKIAGELCQFTSIAKRSPCALSNAKQYKVPTKTIHWEEIHSSALFPLPQHSSAACFRDSHNVSKKQVRKKCSYISHSSVLVQLPLIHWQFSAIHYEWCILSPVIQFRFFFFPRLIFQLCSLCDKHLLHIVSVLHIISLLLQVDIIFDRSNLHFTLVVSKNVSSHPPWPCRHA